jgi:hypothetical protein
MERKTKGLAIHKKNLLEMKAAGRSIKLIFEHQQKENGKIIWLLRVWIDDYPEPGTLVGNRGEIRQWRSLNKAIEFINEAFTEFKVVEIKIK